MIDTATPEGRSARIAEIIGDHTSKSRRKGDHHFRMAVMWGADGDYQPGYDDGETLQLGEYGR